MRNLATLWWRFPTILKGILMPPPRSEKLGGCEEPMKSYGTFWQRFGAAWADFIVLVPLMVVNEILASLSKVAAFALVIPMAASYLGYAIYCHGRFGQTIGKRSMGIRVVRTTGERIGWREAWLRSSVDLGFSILNVIGSFVALAAIADADYYGVGWMRRGANLAAHQPSWLHWTWTATQIWVWSEVVTMLFNKKRRALHDFLAGTVVISYRGDASAKPAAAEQAVAPDDPAAGTS